MKKKILVVDDEHDIVDLLTYNLTIEGYEVVSAHNGEDALKKTAGVDLVILDLMMPVLNGFETCKRLQANPETANIPIVFLTARSGEVDEIVGLELGADDFIQKPISPRKLVARVKAVFRRFGHMGEEQAEQNIIRTEHLEINKSNYTVRFGKKEVFFPKKEFELLSLLAANRGRVYSREVLLDTVWGSNVHVVDRTVDVHIRKIREKLGDDCIETVKGVGYRFRP